MVGAFLSARQGERPKPAYRRSRALGTHRCPKAQEGDYEMRLLPLAFVVAAASTVGLAAAKDEKLPDLTQPMKFGDQAMSCTQIIDEVGSMEARLGGSPASSMMDGEQMAGVGTNLAQRAAISAGAGGAAVGAIGQVGGLLGRSSKKKKEHQAQQRAIAEKRWLYMVGLYQGKNCDAQLAETAVEAAPQSETESDE